MKMIRLLTALLPLTPSAALADVIFEEKSGSVAVEAEHFQSQTKNDVRSWHITSNASTPDIQPDGDPSHAATASGGAYLEILPDTRRSHHDKLIQKENFTNTPGEMAILTYHVKFSTAGRYYCWVRTHSTNTEDNGIHLGINGTWPESGARMQWTAKNTWHWDTKQRTEKKHSGVFGQIWIDVPAPGLHKIHFSMREDGFEFDKFILTTEKPDQKNPPKGSGPEEKLIAGRAPKPTFPKHWGAPPKRQTRDIRTLPYGYGKGSSTLAKWMMKNLQRDAAEEALYKKTAQNLENMKGTKLNISDKHLPKPSEPKAATEKKPAPKKSAYKPKLSAEELKPLQQPRHPDGDAAIVITGNTQWQPLTLTLDGPFAHELDNEPNPFRDYALTVTFTHESGSPEYHVPGYFAADGSAAETSAKSGTKWRAHLSPDKPGKWTYITHFHTGKDVALLPAGEFPKQELNSLEKYNVSGHFNIKKTPKNAPGFYTHGRLTYVNSNYLQFAGSKKPFLKVGADAPETLLGYADFDDTTTDTKKVPLKHYKPHLQDWKKGDPTWQNGKGKGLIGALNYLSGKGMNAFSFLPYNAGGDGDNVWPFVSRDNKFHYDTSKLDQWNIVFTHAQTKGLFLHFKLQETEMDDNRDKKNKTVPTSLDGGDLGPERKLYCREIVARFGHHLALNWNIGEENTQSTQQQMDMAHYLRAVDPYDHHLIVHTYPNQQDKVYKPLQGEGTPFTGASLQNSHLKDCHWQVVKWTKSAAAEGHPWAVAFDEPGDAGHGMPADPGYPGMPSVKDGYKGPTVDDTRKLALWGTLMAGGWGVEYYFGYKLPQNDLVCEDWRSRDQSWTYGKVALDIFDQENFPLMEMKNHDELVGNGEKENKAYCLAKKGLYLVYLPNGGVHKLQLLKSDKANTIRWYNTRTGEHIAKIGFKGSITAPDKNDWLAIIE